MDKNKIKLFIFQNNNSLSRGQRLKKILGLKRSTGNRLLKPSDEKKIDSLDTNVDTIRILELSVKASNGHSKATPKVQKSLFS